MTKKDLTVKQGLLAVLLVLVFFWGAIAIIALATMVAWNLVIPALLGWTALTYPMAVGLTLILWFVSGLFRSSSSRG